MAEAHANKHDYHLVNPSPWPLVGSIGAAVLAAGALMYFISRKDGDPQAWYLLPGLALVVATMYFWWRDVIKEAHQGDHTPVVQLHLRYGMILFIASEVMFFVAWFWAYFDVALFPSEVFTVTETTGDETLGMVSRNEATGGIWPPKDIHTFDPWGLPLINTLILLTSGTTVTWAHHALLKDDRRGLIIGLLLTVILGILFTAFQAYEYAHAAFTFGRPEGTDAESGPWIYGSTFFMATGFHGFHVIVGTICLIVMLFRALAGHFSAKQHFGFEAAAWYWHFVDVVWLFLFVCIYVLGAGTPAAH